MRVILFRGKTTSGDWVQGYYGEFHNRPVIPEPNSIQIFEPREDAYFCGSCVGGFWHAVDRETVGQFTGLLDKNGVKIFEGDIVKFASGITRSVVFSEWLAEFEFDNHDPVENPDGWCLCCDHEYCEVVGNIWDNPELLKGC